MIRVITIAVRQWLLTATITAIAIALYLFVFEHTSDPLVVPLSLFVSIFASVPAFLVLLIALPFLQRMKKGASQKWQLYLLLLLLTCLPYGVISTIVFAANRQQEFILYGLGITAALWICNLFALVINYSNINAWIKQNSTQALFNSSSFTTIKKRTTMEQTDNNYTVAEATEQQDNKQQAYNRILIKAGITAGLILAMLIPASYISKLVDEREQRHHEVVEEVSDKWAAAQTVTTPYLCIPYMKHALNDTGKAVTIKKVWLLPAKKLLVQSAMQPEIRKRSIYEVLLYRSNIQLSGSFTIEPSADIKPEDMLFNEASLCIGISDLQGVEEKIVTGFNNENYDLQPGLPSGSIDSEGLSVPVHLQAGLLAKELAFSVSMKLKGSSTLHFLPLAEESSIAMQSPWPNPSFDGKVLPGERDITANGFTAKWNFNKANMPLISQLGKGNPANEKLAFGVSMIQPGDQYAKTNRSVKYAILFIGLSFAMFFITELIQTKSVHPVQYVLIGLALIIFYTLLLSIGEFTGFNIAYGIAAAATILLVAMYAIQLFKSISVGSLLGLFLGMLYGYIYVLIQLEDTALLAGSIGLFILLALAMHFSRKVKWYPAATHYA